MISAWKLHQKGFIICLGVGSLVSMFWDPGLRVQLFLLALGVGTVGIEHGAIDHRFGKALFRPLAKWLWPVPFVALYLGLAALMLIVWMVNSKIGLLIFLILSIPHFGYVDVNNTQFNGIRLHLLAFCRGTLPIILPFIFSPDEVTKIFNYLMLSGSTINSTFIYNVGILFAFLISPILSLILLIPFFGDGRVHYDRVPNLVEPSMMILIYWSSPVLIAFTIYYCAGHSIREAIEISHEINPDDLINGSITFIKSALPLTVITLVGALMFWFLLENKSFMLNSKITIITFIGLSCLLIPHMVIEYLYEQSDKIKI